MLTSFGGLTTTTLMFWLAIASTTEAWLIANSRISSSVMFGEISKRSLIFPFTWITHCTESSTKSFGSTSGQGARATVGLCPRRSYISSAVYGATKDSMIATASVASRTAGSVGPQPESIALRVTFTSSMVRATATLNR